MPCACTNSSRPCLASYLVWGVFLLSGWFLLYQNLAPASRWFTYGLLGLEQGRHLSAAVEFFVFEAPKVSPGESKCTTSGRIKVHHFGRGVFLTGVGWL